MEGICWCRVVPKTMWVKIKYKNLMLQAYMVLVKLALLVLGGGLMSCPNVGVKFKSQYHSLIMPNLGGVLFLPLGQGDGYAQLDRMDLGKN